MKIKTIIALILIILSCKVSLAQNQLPLNNYEKEWKIADDFIQKSLPKSALDVVITINNRARKEGNNPQLIKTILYKVKLQAFYEEDFLLKNIAEVEAEIKKASFPTKQILQSVLAELYYRYYQNDRYNILNRSITENFKQKDIATWDAKKLFTVIIENFNNSLKDAANLKSKNLSEFDVIIEKGKNGRKFRPTLYDFLAFRAIDFLTNTESGLTKPADHFEINDLNYFAVAKQFATMNIKPKDKLSLEFYTIKLLQDVINFHLNDTDADALIDADLVRLEFVRTKSVLPNKTELYIQALKKLKLQYATYEKSAEIDYLLAKTYAESASKYNPLLSDANKWDNKTAIQYCESAIKSFPKSYFGALSKNILNDINHPTLSISIDNVMLPKQQSLALLTYKNISHLYFRLIKIDYDTDKKIKINSGNQKIINEYLKLTPLQSFETKIPNDGDFQDHKTEIGIAAINSFGYYILLASTDKNFRCEDNIVTYNNFWISNISFINRRKENGTLEYYMLNRNNGTPLKSVVVKAYSSGYDYKTRSYETKFWKEFISNEEGYFEIQASNSRGDYQNIYLEFTDKEDKLVTENESIYGYVREAPKKVLNTFFFTDRAIYRPGQTVYFKGIVLETDGEIKNIKANQLTTVSFFDVNGQKVSDLKLTTNEYGSISGSFTAPMGGLTGQMRIGNEWGNIYFSVEEYKRPKFEVSFNPVKGSYKLNEKISATGTAKAYSGNNIDNANVKYRIVRTARFPYWGWWMRGFYSSSPEMEITNGETKTNDKGEFKIDFIALPDLGVEKELKPVFNYHVFADVTDINGETHSSEENISVGYTALIVDVNIPERINKKNKNHFEISTTNLNGNTEAAEGNIVIFQLKTPDKTFRGRKWEVPDVFSMSKEEFYSKFLYDVYKNEDEISKWEKGKEVLSMKFRTPLDTFLLLKELKNWNQGVYIMEIGTKDIYGTAIEIKKYFTVYADDESKIPDNSIAWFTMLKASGEPGEKASFLIGSKEKEVAVLYEIEVNNQIVSKQWLKINDEQKRIEIPITEAHRGNFAIHLAFVKNNRSYKFDETIIVPFTNKKLDIRFESFRNKLLPGEKEEWKIKIRGSKGEKLAAEMLASMYDASLDAFKTSSWDFSVFHNIYSRLNWEISSGFNTDNSDFCFIRNNRIKYPEAVTYDKLNWFGYNYYGYSRNRMYKNSRWAGGEEMDSEIVVESLDEAPMAGVANLQEMTISKKEDSKNKSGTFMWADSIGGTNSDKEKSIQQSTGFSDVKVRSNFNETAFFYPQLTTNDSGDVLISFTVPESLTKWKMRGLAYTKDLKIGQIQKELVTQKDLMVVPNAPRFFREGDNMAFQVKVSNVSDKELIGSIRLQFLNSLNMQVVNGLLLEDAEKTFTVKAGESQNIAWNISIPEGLGAVTYKVVAKAGNFSDGEEMAIPVLTNRMLVTETLPLPINGRQSKEFKFEKLINSSTSNTLKHQKLTLEFTSNPAWYAVQALPYMMEYPYECAEQVFSRFYANSLASFIANSNPKIRNVFDSWKNISPDALLSNLEKNQELKALLIEETPWLLNAKDESERKKRIGLLFDMNKMASELDAAKQKILKNQLPNGAWAWFPGGKDDRYITQHIVTGFAHLQHLGVNAYKGDYQLNNMLQKAIYYLDERIKEDYDYIRKHYQKDMDKKHLSSLQIQYLYARSYFANEIPLNPKVRIAFDYFKGQTQKYWTSESNYMQGMIALSLKRYSDFKTAADIMKSLKENALYSEEMGMYWRDLTQGYYWYQTPIETMAMLIEAFDEVSNDRESVEKMKIWLLKQKQTQDWKTTKATSEAIYALLLKGTDLLASDKLVEVTVGSERVNPYQSEKAVEAGTGYFKTSWNTTEIKPEMGNITVTKTDDGVAWGAMYWQYFEQLDKITPAATPLKLDKKLFVERNTASGPVIEPIGENAKLKVGDKVKVRIELRVDRDMEYVHLKDMRASAFEPVNVLSGYRWQQGMGYYESTRDAATNFFISYLGKGTYVFEYTLIATQKGNFSNGITSIQCMYAPEFSSHSEGIRVIVE
jgi:uncharacterized protein YfaS (alpha-2-macroglobulin family)